MDHRKWTLAAVLVGMVLSASVAAQPPAAQADSEAEVEDEADTVDGALPEETGTEAPDADTEADTEADTDGSQPENVDISSTRVIDERETELLREQREAERDAEQAQVNVLEEVVEEGRDYSATNRQHEQTVGLRVGMGIGYLFAIQYSNGSPCEEGGAGDFCNTLTEPSLDLEVSYAFTNKLELAAYATLGLTEVEAARAKARAFGIGVRGYTAEEALVKGFFGARLVFDYTQSDAVDVETDGEWRDFDFGLRGEFGITIDVVRWVGIWLGGAVSIRLLRNFTFIPEAGGGLQFRFP